MSVPSRFPRSRRGLAAALLAVHLAGCSQWVPATQPVPEYLREHPNATVRLTLSDGGRHQLTEPRIAGDSLVGLTISTRRASDRGPGRRSADTVALSLADVSRMEVQGGSGGEAVAGILGLLLLAGVVAAGSVDMGGD